MADKHIGALSQATSLDDDSMLVAEQQGTAMKVSGALFKAFARESVDGYVTEAVTAAESAQKSATSAAESLSQIGDSVERSEAAATKAEAAESTVEASKTAAETAATNAANAQALAEKAESNANAAQAGAIAANTAAQKAATSAETAKADAETAQKASETAQKAAESAQSKAESASTTATAKASEAAASADTAKQYSGKPPIVQDGNWWTWDAESQSYTNTGKRAVLGYDKTYASVAEMTADTTQEDNTIAIISSSVEDEDNAKLYICNGGKWGYLTDLSGFTGVGVESITQTGGNHSPGTMDIYTIKLTDGTSKDIQVYNGADGTGVGDMLASIYDPDGKRTDIYQYVDDAIDAIPTPDVSGQIATHNASTSAHQDIRDAIPTKVSELDNDEGYITSYTETDPTVPAWAKAASKPTYTAPEVGAAKPGVMLTVTLPVSGWSNNQQTVSNGAFKTSGYGYIVSAGPDSYGAYTNAVIYADDVSADGTMTFTCGEVPDEDVTASILVVEAE